jgi:hypothetical protein
VALAGLLGALAAVVAVVAYSLRSDRGPGESRDALTVGQAKRKLANGEAVELIGARGLPTYNYYKARTGPEANVFLDPDGTMTVSSQRLGLVELLPDPMRDRYRFRVAVRQNTWLNPESRAGLYCLHRVAENDGVRRHHFVELGVTEDDLAVKELEIAAGRKPPGRITSVACFLRRSDEAPSFRHDNRHVGLEVFDSTAPARGQPEPWRELVIEVTPEAIRAIHRNKRIGMMDRRQLEKSNWSLLSHRPLAPRGGLGVYVFGGSASFRFGAVAPLPENK